MQRSNHKAKSQQPCHPKRHLFIHKRRHWQAVEAVCEGLPKSDVVPPLALIVEAVNPIDGCTLVIATQQKKVFRVFDLQQACSATQRQSDSTLLWILCMCGAGYAPCTRAAGKWFPGSACRGPHSRPGKGSWPLAGNRHTRRAAANRNTGHECLLGKGKASVQQFTRLACVYLRQPSARTDRKSMPAG